MRQPSAKKIATLVAVSVVTLFGAGCNAKKDTVEPRAAQQELRQPAPAAAPSQPPVIPTEAAKIPRPY